jgi:hypothetical protein
VLRAEILLGQQLIVGRAEQSEIFEFRPATARPRIVVMDLQKRTRRAATAVVAHKRTAHAVPRDDLATRRARDVFARAVIRFRAAEQAGTLRARTVGLAEALLGAQCEDARMKSEIAELDLSLAVSVSRKIVLHSHELIVPEYCPGRISSLVRPDEVE